MSGINDILELKDRFSQLPTKMRMWTIEIINSNLEYFEDANIEQLLEGRQPNGSEIRPEYRSEPYARLKQKITPNSKRGFYTPNLKFEGDFYRSITAKLQGFALEVFATDPKADNLQRKYGQILGVSDPNILEFIQEIYLPEIFPRIRVFLNLN